MTDRLLASLRADSALNPSFRNSRFTIWGWTKDREVLSPGVSEFALQRAMDCRTWEYGDSGIVFLLNSHPDIAYTDQAVVVKLGFARSESFEPLSAQDLLERGLAAPEGIRHDAIHGDVSLISISQREPIFSAYQNVVSTSQLFYWRGQDAILCSDTLRHLTAMIDGLDMDPQAVLLHLMYRSVSGELTYLKDVRKLLCGHVMNVRAGQARVQQVERLDDLRPERTVAAVTPEAVAGFERDFERLLGAYVEQTTWSDQVLTISLTGGVDSTLLGDVVKRRLEPGAKLRSTSAAIRVPSFAPEVEYAAYGAHLLDTEHEYVDVYPEDYPDLLVQSIATVARPIAHEIEACYMAMARFHSQKETGCIWSGSAADSLLGSDDSRRWLQVERLQRIPKARPMLQFLGHVLEPVWHDKAYGMREAAEILSVVQDPEPSGFPTSHTNFEMVRKCFGAQSVAEGFQYKNDLHRLYTSSSNLVESTHLMAISNDVHDEEIDFVQMLQTCGLCGATPYLDSDFVGFTLAFDPSVRFYANGRTKWLLKTLVEERVGYHVDQRPKNAGGFSLELFHWMKDGVLRDLVDSIERPGYLTAADFERIRAQPDWFTWNILNLDLFRKRFVKRA